MTGKTAISLLLIGVVLGCQARPTPRDWPATITYERLDLSNREALSAQSYRVEQPKVLTDALREPGRVFTREYAGIKGPTGHGFMGTTVYYDTKLDQFYFHSNCGMGHNDGIIGPFEGDPRIVLDPFDGATRQEATAVAAEPDPFVGWYTAFNLPVAGQGYVTPYLLERDGYDHAVMICKQGDHYLINIEEGLRFIAPSDHGLTPEQGTRGVTVRFINRTPELDELGALHLQDWTFTLGFALFRGVGPATYGATDPRTGEDRTSDWFYKRVVSPVKNRPGRDAVIGELTYRGTPFGPLSARDGAQRLGSILITPIGKFMYFGPASTDPDEIKYHSGWLNEIDGKPLFNDDGSLTERGRVMRINLKQKNH